MPELRRRARRAAEASGVSVRHLYVHLPFCAHRCGYCDFVTAVGRPEQHGAYVDALLRELELERGVLADPLETVFLGGGTPTFTALPELLRLLAALPPAAEVTVEANPETVTPELARALRGAGVTRVSLGAQSFQPRAPARARARRAARRRPPRVRPPARRRLRQPLARPHLRHPRPDGRRPRGRPRRGARTRPRAPLLLRARGEAGHALHACVRRRARAPGGGDGGLLRARRRDAHRRRVPLVRDGELLPRRPPRAAQPRLLARPRLPRDRRRRRVDARRRTPPEHREARALPRRRLRPRARDRGRRSPRARARDARPAARRAAAACRYPRMRSTPPASRGSSRSASPCTTTRRSPSPTAGASSAARLPSSFSQAKIPCKWS